MVFLSGQSSKERLDNQDVLGRSMSLETIKTTLTYPISANHVIPVIFCAGISLLV